MDFLTPELIEKFLNPNLLISFWVMWGFIKKQTAGHFSSVEKSLETISKNVNDLKDAIVDLEKSQTKKISELNERVTKLELKK